MTTASDKAEKEAAKELVKARKAEIDAKQVEANKGKSGKGLRTFFGMSRGRNPQMIEFENWDVEKEIDKGETLPETYADCLAVMAARGLKEAEVEPAMVRRFILGDNELLYTEASDPVAEFVDASWPEADKKTFKLVIKGYAASTGVSIEDAVALLKPGFTAAAEKRMEEATKP